MGMWRDLRVCTSVRASMSSSRVPKPPGMTTYAEANLTNITFRAKKWWNVWLTS